MSNPVVIITDREGKIVNSAPSYTSYSFNSEVFSISDSFELLLADNTTDISDWYAVQLRVENEIIFTGTIQAEGRSFSAGSIELSLSGKDRGKFLEETFCSSFKDFKNTSPVDIVNALIDQTQFYSQPVSNYSDVIAEPDWDDQAEIDAYNNAVKFDIKENKAFLKSENKTIFDSNFTALPDKKLFKIEIGDTVGTKLIDLVRSVGMDIFYRQDGSLFFGKLDNLRDATSKRHRITLKRKEGGTGENPNNNVLEGDVGIDNSGQYSDITVISQTQNGKNTSATAQNRSVVDKKTMIVALNDDETSPEVEAIRIRNDQTVEAFSASYTSSGHVDSDSGEKWTLNRNTRMDDQINNVIGDFVLTSVNYTFDTGEGYKTLIGITEKRDPRLII